MDKKTIRTEILTQAENIITGDRNKSYGEPEDSFAKIAEYWNVYLNMDLSGHDVALMMLLLKVARTAGDWAYRDNYIDMAGYAACAGEIAENIMNMGRKETNE